MNRINKILILSFISISLPIISATLAWSENFNDNISINTLEQQAKEFYQRGNLSEAIPLLQQAITEHQQQGNLPEKVTALRNLALIYQQLGQWQQAKNSLVQGQNTVFLIKDKNRKNQLKAQLLEVQGQIELSLGEAENALNTWQQATTIYEQIGDLTGFTQGKIYQAQALQSLGLYSQALQTLTKIKTKLETEPDTLLKIKSLNTLGNVYRRVGNYQQSETVLKEALAIAKKLESEQNVADILLSLGNLTRLQTDNNNISSAWQLYEQAINTSRRLDTKLQAKLNQLNLLVQSKEITENTDFITEIEQLIEKISLNKTRIEAQINLARNLIFFKNEPTKIAQLLGETIKQSQNLGIKTTESEALGILGNLYEINEQWQNAEKITEQALLISQRINAREQSYQWQWQLGRIFKAQGDNKKAIAAYTQAVENLRFLRGDKLAQFVLEKKTVHLN